MGFKDSQEGASETAPGLQNRLLRGEIGPDVFLDSLTALDQSSPHHELADTNIEILTSESVKAYFAEHPEYYSIYYNLISLSHFHVGQNQAMNGEKTNKHFSQALVAAERAQTNDSVRWTEYVRATVAYFDNDTATMESILANLPDGNNRKIIAHMLKGLKERGETDYRADYGF